MPDNVWVVVQARLGSKRFPRKVLADLNGKPMLRHLLDNLITTGLPVAVITPDEEIRDRCVEWRHVVLTCPEQEDDVLFRYVLGIRYFSAEHVVRITADCPLTQPEMVKQFVDIHLREDADYTTNTITRSYPDGLDVEVIRASRLEYLHHTLSTRPDHREHVTTALREPWWWPHDDRLCIVNVSQRLTVDTPEDLERIQGATNREPFVEIVSEGRRGASTPEQAK